jgi:ATP-dependent Clp protease ATP-binding subunit ClpA
MKDLDLNTERAEVYLKWIMRGSSPIQYQQPPLDLALDEAINEANWLDSHYVGTAHLLLGITRANVGNAIDLLRLVEIPPEKIRRRIREAVKEGVSEYSLETARHNSRLSELGRRVLNGAEDTAIRLDHPLVGVSHILYALMEERRGVTSQLLQQCGVQTQQLQAHLEITATDIAVSIEDLLQEAVDEAEKLGHHYVGANHLLLVLVSNTQTAILLERYGVANEKLKRLLTKHLQQNYTILLFCIQ